MKKNNSKQKSSSALNQKGQAFEAYRLLIAMVIALAVLVIILSAVAYFDDLRKRVSRDTLYSAFQSAVDSPNGKVVQASDLAFTKDTTYSRVQFAKQMGLDPACIQLDADKDAGFELNDDNPDTPFVRVLSSVQGSVYMQCHTQNVIIPPGPDSCFVYCILSFGKLIRSE